MAQTEDRKLTEFVRDHLPRLHDRLAPLTVIAFGSRVRGDALSTSDLDLIVVSPCFEPLHFLKRVPYILELLGYPAGLEFLCYTPDEFHEKRREHGIVRVAVEEGIRLA